MLFLFLLREGLKQFDDVHFFSAEVEFPSFSETGIAFSFALAM